MTATVLRASDITRSLVAQLQADVRMGGVSVSRAGEVNERPSACPWIGIYRARQSLTPRTLGATVGAMNHEIYLVLIIQAAGGNTGEDCEDMLEEVVSNTASAILNDPSIGGTVLIVKDIEVRYQDYSRVDDVYMQTAALYLTAETRVSIS